MMWSEVLGEPHPGWGIGAGRTRGPAAVAVGPLGAALGRAAEASRALGEAIHASLSEPMRDLADSLESLTPRGGRLSARAPHEQHLPSLRPWAGTSPSLEIHDEVAHWHAPRGRAWGKASGTGGGRPPGYPSEKVPAGSRVPGPPPAERPRVAPSSVYAAPMTPDEETHTSTAIMPPDPDTCTCSLNAICAYCERRPSWSDDDYPEDHGPYCPRSCDHPCHDRYDEWAAQNGRGGV